MNLLVKKLFLEWLQVTFLNNHWHNYNETLFQKKKIDSEIKPSKVGWRCVGGERKNEIGVITNSEKQNKFFLRFVENR